MYLLFRFHHILPNQYWNIGSNEKRVLKAFMHKELEDMKEENKALRGDG